MPFSLLSKQIPQLIESNGLWEQEFLIAFHFKISSLFSQKNWETHISDFQKKKTIHSWELKISAITYHFNLHKPEKAYLKILWCQKQKWQQRFWKYNPKFRICTHFMLETSRFQFRKHPRTRRFTGNREVGYLLINVQHLN